MKIKLFQGENGKNMRKVRNEKGEKGKQWRDNNYENKKDVTERYV